MKLGPSWANFAANSGILIQSRFCIHFLYISIYKHVYRLFSCISCFRTSVFRLSPVFLHFWPRICCFKPVYRRIMLYTVSIQPLFRLFGAVISVSRSTSLISKTFRADSILKNARRQWEESE